MLEQRVDRAGFIQGLAGLGGFAEISLLLGAKADSVGIDYWRTVLPSRTYNIAGLVRRDPINVILLGNEDQVRRALEKGRWLEADSYNPVNLTRAIYDACRSKPYPTEPITPEVLWGRYQDLGYQIPGPDAQSRWHARGWDSNLTHPDNGKPIWAFTVTEDSGIEVPDYLQSTVESVCKGRVYPGNLFSHHISPDVDKARAFLGQTLAPFGSAKLLAVHRPYSVTQKVHGKDQVYYHTDGKVGLINLTLKP